jgi:mono/diheme cytochrome c family protein
MHSRGTWLLVTGVALLAIGVVGMVVVFAAAPQATVTVVPRMRGGAGVPGGGGFSIVPTGTGLSAGETIYLSGVGASGPVPRSGGPAWFQRMGGGCALCHGYGGRGGVVTMMMTRLQVPDIRYTTLRMPHPSDTGTGTEPGWTDAEIVTAITTGVEPTGAKLDTTMPRWDLTPGEADSLLAYLKELDSR